MRNHAPLMRCSVAAAAGALLTGCAGIEPFRELACVEAADVSLEDAIAAAQRRGGKAIAVNYRQDKELGCVLGNPGVYDVTLLKGSEISTVSIDAESGSVRPAESGDTTLDFGKHAIEKLFEGERSIRTDVVPDLSISMSQAADIAESAAGGKAMAAWVDTDEGRPGFRVKLAESGRTRTAWVDGTMGFARLEQGA